MDEINKRIIEWMVKSGHSKSTFARELNVSLPLITHITSGRNKPGLDLMQKLLSVFPDLNPDWLLNGIGEMTRERPKTIDLSAELVQMELLKDLTNSTLNKNKTTKAFHRMLIDELLHLQEIDLEIDASESDLRELIVKVNSLKEQIILKVNV